ncbi:MAG: tyrosine--tRNA ligase [Bacteroides sp.]
MAATTELSDFVAELSWRGMLHNTTPGAEAFINKEQRMAYVGIDPTADSLHIGHLVSVMMLRHFQRCGHKPVVLVGGATGMIGDPSGKSVERNLLSSEQIEENLVGLKKQLARLINFDEKLPNAALLVNNYDWMSKYSFISFIRDIGKHITVNYMMAKDSVKRRFDPTEGTEGLSFTEFSYQLIQATDFLHLHRELGLSLQMGGSDQWGNMTTGVELIRRMDGHEVHCITCPLIKKADGRKFGKTEQGNIWLDPQRTSPYTFYQFWLNVSDEEAKSYIRIFTLLDKPTIEQLEAEQQEKPHERALQKALAREVTTMVHGEVEYQKAVKASDILFGKATAETLREIDEQTFLAVFAGVPTFEIAQELLANGNNWMMLLTEASAVYPSKGEARRALQGGALSINKTKIEDLDLKPTLADAISGKYFVVQKGKKNYVLLVVR